MSSNPFDQFDAGTDAPAATAVAAPPQPTSPLEKALVAEGVQDHPVAGIARSIYQQESGSGVNTKTSNAGAVGGMQVIPATFSRMADPGWDISNPDQNAQAGVRYIKTLYDRAGGDPALTAAGYYGGEGAIDKARQGVAVADPRNPNAPNTLQYAQQVVSRMPQSSPTSSSAANPFDVFDGTTGASAAPKALDPTEGNSFLENAAIGAGKAVTDMKAGFQQRVREGLEALGGKSVADGMQLVTPADIAEKRRLDAPVMQTTGGKVGSFVAQATPATIAALTPGGQTLAANLAIGATTGLLQPTVGDESVLKNTIRDALGGAAGWGVAKTVGALANRSVASAADAATKNAARDTVAAAARDAGYTIPPTQTNPTILNRVLEGFSGKISTAQKASGANQEATNQLAAKALGLPTDQPLTQAALSKLRNDAGTVYQMVGNSGTVRPTSAYGAALDKIMAPYTKAAQGFPNAPVNPVVKAVEGLRSSQFDAASAVSKISELRDMASSAYAGGDKITGKALKSAADAIEDALDTHLQGNGAPNLLNLYRAARTDIAKSYTVGNALNDATGNVNATKLAGDFTKGKPISGDLLTIAKTAKAFPTATKEVTSSMPGISPLDFHGASMLGILGHGALGAATAGASLVARPVVRAGILSKPFQSAMGAPSYTGSTALNLLASQPGIAAIHGAVPTAIADVAHRQGYADGGMVGAPQMEVKPRRIADVARSKA